MSLGQRSGGIELQHLFDEIDPPAGAVELIAEELIGRAGGKAKSTVHTAAQNGVGFLPPVGPDDVRMELGAHQMSA